MQNLQNAFRHCKAPLEDILAALTPHEAQSILLDWPLWARADQLPPDFTGTHTHWKTWILLGGRGAGKTRAGAEWIRYQALGKPLLAVMPAGRIALVGPTLGEVCDTMVEGISGILAVHGESEKPDFISSKGQLVWPNGAVAQLFSAQEPDSLRGPQFDVAWCDELAKWNNLQATWDMLQFGLRLGSYPRTVVTTTPRPLKLLKMLLEDASCAVSRARTYDNADFLAASFLGEIERQYGGTRLGRQEIDGEIINDNPDALFARNQIEADRVSTCGALERIVVAVDPPITSNKTSNACGIICAGIDARGHGYVLEDATEQQASPLHWARKAIALYHAMKADALVVEVNQGGEMVSTILAEVDPLVPVKPVQARRSKHLRAEPVAALYEQHRISHVKAMPELEDELCAFEQITAKGSKSPDRVDALVWAITELMLRPKPARPRISVA